MKKEINTPNAPKAIGTYSQAVATENLLFISGQIPLDPVSMNLVDGIENQIRQAFENIKNIFIMGIIVSKSDKNIFNSASLDLLIILGIKYISCSKKSIKKINCHELAKP